MSIRNQFTNEELSRYSRHITLDKVGLAGQNKLKNASILVVGSGGLGSPVIQYLAAAGIGELGIVDNDIVDLSNLQRQVIHNLNYIGISKTISASNWVESINPNCKVNQHNELVDSENAEKICRDYEIICDCTDNFTARYVLNDVTVKQGKPYIYGSILGFEGQVGVFNLTSCSPSYRDLVPTPPPPDLLPSCVENGVLGVLPGIIGTLQATEAIKIILGKGIILDGKILTYNALKMSFHILNLFKDDKNKFAKNDEKPVDEPDPSGLNIISAKELQQLITEKKEFLLVDVRSPAECDICSINHSINIPSDTILNDREKLDELIGCDVHKKIILYCKSGFRSEKCLSKLQKSRKNIYSLKGGILGWIENVDNSMPRY